MLLAVDLIVVYRHRVPRPPLDAYIESIWLYEADARPHSLERILPTGAPQLIVNLKEDQTRLYHAECGNRCDTTSGTVLGGARSRHCIIDTAEQEYVLGVVFRPGGTVPFTRVPAHEMRDAHIPLDVLWGRGRVTSLRERLLETRDPDAKLETMEQALAVMWQPRGLHPSVAFALNVFCRRPLATSITAVTAGVGLSPKRFIERFKNEVGLTPKRYCRIMRFQQAVGRAHAGRCVDWVQVALDCGYFDQAHFIHDFRSFAGLTPTGYQAARTEFQNHVKFLQSDTAQSLRG
jgi:AraC-like DNA-binding protein